MEELEAIQMVLGVLLFGFLGLAVVLGVNLYKEGKEEDKDESNSR